MMTQENKIALLIDCDNVSHKSIEGVIDELSKYGKVNIRHAYGNWKSKSLTGWEEKLHPHAIKPIQQFAYTTGKNATDAAMIIDAMDLLYTGNFNGFCIVSSDSDFTKLASRIREAGLIVYGFGEQKTPPPFVSACDKFIYTEVLRARADEEPTIVKKSSSELKQNTKLVSLLRNAAEVASDESGWADLASIGSNIAKQAPDFDSRNYGYAKLGELVTATKLFDLEQRRIGDTNSKALYIRDKRHK